MICSTMLSSDRPPEPLSEHVGYLMNWAANRSRRAFVTALTPLGLRPPLYGLMVVAQANPGRTQQQLAELSQIDPSTLVAQIDELEAMGMAERRPHAEDRRKRAIHLTSKGERTLVRARELATAVGADLVAPLNARERAELTRLLHKLTGLDER
jgi:MarR family transcriptional regulator, lower aerobic nicotinate degradation pathway regulator